MIKKQKNITDFLYPMSVIILILALWQGLISLNIVEEYLLPSPLSVVKAIVTDFNILVEYSVYTLTEGLTGLFLSIMTAYIIAVLMDRVSFLYKAVYPVLIMSQTVPIIAIAPLLVLWLGYGIMPKIVLVMLTCFFPLTVGILDGFRNADSDAVSLLKAMGANKNQILYHIKLPESLPHFFAGLKIAVSYSIVGAVTSEWIGGTVGLGVYMTRVKKSFAFDKMFGVIFIIVIISLVLMELVKLWERKVLK